MARQAELLAYDANAEDAVTLLCSDARALDEAWTGARCDPREGLSDALLPLR